MFRFKSPLIYIIDNSAGYRKVLASMLSALNYTNIKTFKSTTELLKEKSTSPDIVVLDYNQGDSGINGIEFINEYSLINSNTSFVFFSSNTKLEIAVETIQRGAVDYIVKSTKGLEKVIMRIESLAGNKRKMKRNFLFNRFVLVALLMSTTAIIIASWVYVG